MNTQDQANADARAWAPEVSAANQDAARIGVRHILMPADCGESSWAAWRYSRWLADQFGANITIAYAFTGQEPHAGPGAWQETAGGIAGLKSAKVQAIFMRRGGHDARQIANIARYEHADLIVISADYAPKPSRFFHGHTIADLIHHAPCPVLVLPEPAHPDPTKNRIAL